jgi:hypothetical protein
MNPIQASDVVGVRLRVVGTVFLANIDGTKTQPKIRHLISQDGCFPTPIGSLHPKIKSSVRWGGPQEIE